MKSPPTTLLFGLVAFVSSLVLVLAEIIRCLPLSLRIEQSCGSLLSKLGENEKLDVGGESSICLGVRSMIRDAMIFRSKGGLALEFQGKCCGALHFVQLLRASSSPAVCEQNNRYNPDTEVED